VAQPSPEGDVALRRALPPRIALLLIPVGDIGVTAGPAFCAVSTKRVQVV
jgi:hypothetical protein